MSSLHRCGNVFRGFLRNQVMPHLMGGQSVHTPPACRIISTSSASQWVEALASDLRIAGCHCSVNRQAEPGVGAEAPDERVIVVGTVDLPGLVSVQAPPRENMRNDQRVLADELLALQNTNIPPILIQLTGGAREDVFPGFLRLDLALDCRNEAAYFSCFFKVVEALYGPQHSITLAQDERRLNELILTLSSANPINPATTQNPDYKVAMDLVKLDQQLSTVLSPNSANAVDALSAIATAAPVPFATPSKMMPPPGEAVTPAPPHTPLPYATPDAATTLSKLSQLAHATSFVVSDLGEVPRRPRQRGKGRGRTLLPPTSKSATNENSTTSRRRPASKASSSVLDDDDGPASKRARTTRTNAGDKEKSLRHLSLQVCDKVRHKDLTTYNEVADELVADLAAAGNVGAGHNEKNIRRRVYDALNVLEGMEIILREKKKIQWAGLPGSSEVASLEHNKNVVKDRIAEKKQYLSDIIMQHVTLDNLMLHNNASDQNRSVAPGPKAKSQLFLPFVLVNAHPRTEIECLMNDDKSQMMFTFSSPFEIHDDSELLRGMGMTEKVPKNSQVTKILPKKILSELDLNVTSTPVAAI